MPTPTRLLRIADRIHQEISEMLVMGKINDPRLTDIFITDVKVDRELSVADIFVSAIEGEERVGGIMKALLKASGFIRRYLTNQIELRIFPQLRFHWDPTPERAERIERLIDVIHEQKKNE